MTHFQNKLQKTFLGNNDSTSIWFMRQAGRYLSEYMAIRSHTKDFLELCYDAKKAATVTLQPIERFDFDAAIIFSDILVLPHMLGWPVTFQKGEGPILQKFETWQDLDLLKDKFDSKINNVYEAINIVRDSLSQDKSLIGFAGGPWTVTSYMLEGRGKQDFSASKNFIYTKRELALALMEVITDKTIEHLCRQIEAGCDVIQLFDSWSGMLSGSEYEDFIIKQTKKITTAIKNKYKHVPVIGFPRGSGYLYQEYIDKTGVDGVSVDQFVPVYMMKKWQDKLVVQGNLDPVLLLGNKEVIARKAEDILSCMGNKNFIFNLGHGILPGTPVKNVEFLVNYVRKY